MAQVEIVNGIRLNSSLIDYNGGAGTSGQILSSTGDGVNWVSLTDISGVNGTGTQNYVAKWSDTDTITDSVIYDDGTNVGIGTASPTSLGSNITTLDIQGSSGGGLRFGTTGGVEGGIYTIGSGTYIGSISNVPLYITTNNSTKATILANGNVGIDNNSPSEKLEIGPNSSAGSQNKLRINYWDGVENISQLWVNGAGSIDVSFNTTTEGSFSIRGYDNSSFTTYAFWSGSSSTLGRMRLNQYGSGSFTGTATKMLAVTATGIVVEETLPTNSNTTYDLTVPASTTAIRLAGSDATNDDVTISGTTNETEVTRISATELRVGLPTDVTIAGTTTTNNIIYNTPTGTSTVYRGELVDFGGFEGSVSAGDLVVLRHTLGLPQWYQADYNSSVNATGMLGVYDGTDVLVRGYVQNSSFSFTTSGVPLYMGASGAISTSAPTGNGDFVRIIGYVADAANDRIYICPDNTWVEITA